MLDVVPDKALDILPSRWRHPDDGHVSGAPVVGAHDGQLGAGVSQVVVDVPGALGLVEIEKVSELRGGIVSVVGPAVMGAAGELVDPGRVGVVVVGVGV